MVRRYILALATIAALGGAAGLAYAEDKPDSGEMAKLMAARTTLAQAIAIAEKETGGTAIDAGFQNENGATTLEVEVLKDKTVSKVIVDAETGKVVKVTVADAEDGENGGENN
jgi:uncharacterized membrane protein YkoI